jgi:hypothetical protein
MQKFLKAFNNINTFFLFKLRRMTGSESECGVIGIFDIGKRGAWINCDD